MNDFTKQELEILSRALTYYVGENAGKIILGKLQDLINNYCECVACKKERGEALNELFYGVKNE